jgi:histidinol-phosphate aminotransferase
MAAFDRRGWLRSITLAATGLMASRRLTALATATSDTVRQHVPILNLSLNENPFGPAPSVIPAIERELGNLSRYTTVELGNLIAQIAAKEGVSAGKIILGEILEPLGTYLSLQGGAGGEFVYSNPGYTALIDAAVAVGGIAIPVPLDGRLQNDLAAFREIVSKRTRAVFLVNPHNPTGTVTAAAEFKHFVEAVSQHALVIVDEAYLDFADDYAGRTLAGLVRADLNVIVFRTFAKAYGLAGLDIGYGLGPRRIAQALDRRGLNNPHLFNRLAVVAACASLRETNYLGEVIAKVAQERELWIEFLRDLNVRFANSQGNFVFFETGIPHAQFAASLLGQGIDIGRAFLPYDRWARISIGLPQENLRVRAAVHTLLSG